MLRTCFQYRLYPKSEQIALLEEHLQICRHLYNGALFERQDAWKHERRSVGYSEQQRQLPLLKRKAQSLSSVYSQTLQDVLQRLQKAYDAFFRRLNDYTERKAQGKLAPDEEPPRPPRYKGRNHYNSLVYPQWGAGVKLEAGTLVLSKIGSIPIRQHRRLQGTPKTCSIIKKADGWYACISCEVEVEPLPPSEEEVGIDLGIENFATLTDGHPSIPNPRPLEQAQAQLRKAQRRLERRSRYSGGGKQRKLLAQQSKRREKARLLLAKAHLRVARARADFHHKVAQALVQQFGMIYVERLNIKGMLTNHPLAHHIADVGWGNFLSILTAKAHRAGRTLVEVNPWRTSQNCSQCGEYVPKSLSQRTHSCAYCGLVVHRDKNAAENIRKLGRDAAVGRERSALAQA